MHYMLMLSGYFYLFILVFTGLLLLFFAYGLFSSAHIRDKKKKTAYIRGTIGEKGVCPVCSRILRNGEQIKSALFPGDKERVCHIFGCPHCHPYTEETVQRSCPVCKKTLPAEGYLIARLFERPNNKRHVHILGCTNCRVPHNM